MQQGETETKCYHELITTSQWCKSVTLDCNRKQPQVEGVSNEKEGTKVLANTLE
jgi:hypothetical protein